MRDSIDHVERDWRRTLGLGAVRLENEFDQKLFADRLSFSCLSRFHLLAQAGGILIV